MTVHPCVLGIDLFVIQAIDKVRNEMNHALPLLFAPHQ